MTPTDDTSDIEDYLDTTHGLTSGTETEVDLQRAGDVQAFRDYAERQRRQLAGGEID